MSGSGGNRGRNCGEKRGGREKRDHRKGMKLRKYTLQEKERNYSDDEQWCKNM